ncbi:MAG: HAMP domain-containing histidine kinase, partial [Bacteroidales bacterium]|nr:HAMP domain-containing histidine kinase [Bacteroidales bacterium]
ANMSHEIRTPMNSIIGFISLLQEDNLSDAEKTEYLDIVRSNGDRLLSTLNDIVDISKIESGQAVVNQSAFDMNEVLLNCYGLFRQDAFIKQLEFQRPALLMPDVSYIRSDKEKIYSIVTNLVKNALKYTTKGFVKFDCSINDGELFFTVVDSGIGIPMEKQRAIFDRFVQVDSQRKSTYEGAGLGLAITKAFVELLGGDIAVESEEGKGSTFYVRIPVEPATPMMAGNG